MRRPLLLLALCLAGCDLDDVGDACDRGFACEVDGLDLAIVSVEPQWQDDQPRDPGSGLHVVAPGDSIRVRVVVANRGSEHAAPVGFYIAFRDYHLFDDGGGTLPGLRFGESVTFNLVFPIDSGPRFVKDGLVDGDIRFELRGSALDADVDSSNHDGLVRFLVAAPLLDVSVASAGDTLRVGSGLPIQLTVTNSSSFDFDGSTDFVFCVAYDGDAARCEAGELASTGVVHVGPVAAQASRTFERTINPTNAMLFPVFEAHAVRVTPCVPREEGPVCLDPASVTTVAIPDLAAACPVVALAATDTLRVAEALCEGRGAEEGRWLAVGVIDGGAGEEWCLTNLGSAWERSIRDEDLALQAESAGACFTLAAAGPHYVIVHADDSSDPGSGVVEVRRT